MNCVLCSTNHIFCCLLNIMLKGMMTRIAFLLQLQWTTLLCIFEHVFRYALASFWRAYIHTEVNLLGQRIYIFPILLNTTRLFKQKNSCMSLLFSLHMLIITYYCDTIFTNCFILQVRLNGSLCSGTFEFPL